MMPNAASRNDLCRTQPVPAQPRRVAGFTLIELMITVAIVAILSMVAIPSYLEYIRRGTESAAQQWLMEISSAQAEYLINWRSYGTLAEIGMSTAPAEVSDYYTLTLVEDEDCAGAASTPGYCVTATPIAGKRQAVEATLQLDHKGNKLPTTAWN